MYLVGIQVEHFDAMRISATPGTKDDRLAVA